MRYSPSSTLTFAQCPLKWTLGQAGWTTQTIDKKTIAAMIGSAISVGMEKFHLSQIDSEGDALPADEWCPPSHAAALALAEMENVMERATDAGRIVPPELEAEYAAAPGRVKTAVEYLVSKQPLSPRWETVGAEFVLEKWGNARIDLLVDSPDGLVVVDYKSSITATAYQLAQKAEGYRYSNQLYHYVAALRDLGHQVDFTAIAQVVIEPRPKLHLWHYEVDEGYLERLRKSWARLWMQMDFVKEHSLVPEMALEHKTQYGLCEFAPLCLEGAGDLGLANLLGFVQQERTR